MDDARVCRGGAFNQAVRELVSHYVAMEEFCMEANVAKAVEIREHSDDSLTTSMVDDAFFILQKVCTPANSGLKATSVSFLSMCSVACYMLEKPF